MFIKRPKDSSPEELYRWAAELCELINRNQLTKNERGDEKDGVQIQGLRRK